MNFETMKFTKIDLIKIMGRVTSLPLLDSKIAVEKFLDTYHLGEEFTKEDIGRFTKFCGCFSKGVLVMEDNKIFPAERLELTFDDIHRMTFL